MEPRKWKYNNRRKTNYKRVTFLLSIVMIYAIFSFFLKSLPVSYAWFTADTSSKGQIVNATTSDLIQIIPDRVIYDNNRRVKAKLSVRNISNIDIPLKVELIVKNQVLDTSSILLYQNDTFTTGWEKIDHIPEDAKDIQVRIIGFQGYINEMVTYNIDQEKVKLALTSKEIVNQGEIVKPNTNASNQTMTTDTINIQGK